MKVSVDHSRCIGAANCIALAPSVFRMGDAGKAVVLEVSSMSEATLREAAESCPADAIILEDDSGRRLYPAP